MKKPTLSQQVADLTAIVAQLATVVQANQAAAVAAPVATSFNKDKDFATKISYQMPKAVNLAAKTGTDAKLVAVEKNGKFQVWYMTASRKVNGTLLATIKADGHVTKHVAGF